MSRVLVVEDSRFFSNMVAAKLAAELGLEIAQASTYAEALALIEAEKPSFLLALLDLNLPDAPQGEIVDLVTSKGIPAIVFTGQPSDELRDYVWSKKVVDYVLKESAQALEYIVALIRRIRRNSAVKVLVVDDSRLSRGLVRDLLQVHQYQVLEASSGAEALAALERAPDIRLVITDYSMPGMDGFELTKEIRRRHSKESLAIIGISAFGNNTMAARFMKNGASDFVNKPIVSEEFYCRVTQNIELLDHIRRLEKALSTDYLTGLYNRRFFVEAGEKLRTTLSTRKRNAALAVIDIDRFKHVNDTLGHEAGDEVLRQVGRLLLDHFTEADIVSRFGGDEFCILAPEARKGKTVKVLEEARQSLARSGVSVAGSNIEITLSIGVCSQLGETLDDMMRAADACLYEAKNSGRDQIVTL